MITATAAEVQNNFGHFLQAVSSGDEILITQNGKEIARIIPREKKRFLPYRFADRYSEK